MAKKVPEIKSLSLCQNWLFLKNVSQIRKDGPQYTLHGPSFP